MADEIPSQDAAASSDLPEAQNSAPSDNGRPDPLKEQLAASTAGHYTVERELGAGGMATVYLAHDTALDRKVAIKVMHGDLFKAGEVAIGRFLREARTGARLNHPHIIPVYAIKEERNLIYFVMKFIDGKPLDTLIREVGPLPIPLVARVLAQAADALAYAHRNGIVHRDVKPGNLLLDKEGWVVLTDLGIAKVAEASQLTATGSAVGTPTYMSPEQATGEKDITGASDQYSLGCVAFEMLTGRVPFEAESVVGLIFQHVADPPPPIHTLRPDCPADVAAAVHRMLQKAPEDRYQSLEEVAQFFRDVSVGDEEEFRLLLRAYATGHGQTQAIKRMNTPRPQPRDRTPTPRPASRPSKREVAISTTGMQPVARDRTLGGTPIAPVTAPATGDGTGAAPATAATGTQAWPRTLLRPPEQAARSRSARGPLLALAMIAIAAAAFYFTPGVGSLTTETPDVTALMNLRQAEAEAAVRRGQAAGDSTACAGVRMDLPSCRKHIIVPISDISPDLVTAVVAAEDSLFAVRTGVDWSAMRMAAGYPRTAFEWGNSTDRADLFAVLPGLLEQMNAVGPTGSLTQRVAQIVWYPAPTGLYSKLREVLVSRRVAQAVSKDRLVELYLNLAEFGPGLYGAEAAAQAYFGVPAKRLTKAQAATLAATLATPRTSTPLLEPAAMRRRQALILRRLNGEAVSIPQGATAASSAAPPSPTP